jgi:hypothetical protein
MPFSVGSPASSLLGDKVARVVSCAVWSPGRAQYASHVWLSFLSPLAFVIEAESHRGFGIISRMNALLGQWAFSGKLVTASVPWYSN